MVQPVVRVNTAAQAAAAVPEMVVLPLELVGRAVRHLQDPVGPLTQLAQPVVILSLQDQAAAAAAHQLVIMAAMPGPGGVHQAAAAAAARVRSSAAQGAKGQPVVLAYAVCGLGDGDYKIGLDIRLARSLQL